MPLINKKLLQDSVAKHKYEIFNQRDEFKTFLKETLDRIEAKKFKKEESEKVSFLQKMFELLGYQIHKDLEFEYTTQSRSIDAVLGEQTEQGRAVEVAIEWKGLDTKNLDKGKAGETPVSQMWDYMGKTNTNFGIVGNFLEWRLYTKHKGQTEYYGFSLRELIDQEKKIDELIFLLRKNTLLKRQNKTCLLEDLISQSEVEQAQITKKFYNDYRQRRINLFHHLIENNQDANKYLLLEKAQKVLDRLVFIMFCEDGYLVPANILKQTFELGVKSRSRSETKIWEEFQYLFEDINKGRDDLNLQINAFNGGLFAEDLELNSLIIKDKIWTDLIKLAEYDFASDLNVNILGHIFEQSISDIEDIKTEIAILDNENDSLLDNNGEPLLRVTIKPVLKGKRKKDGIYYTPEYITNYIVSETVGRWLEDNPGQLEQIKILDPAGGSGAFPNQVHTYLAKKHAEKIKTEAEKADFAQSLIYIDEKVIDKSILRNNIFMVDLQPESVEIAKLSLWLKTAKKDQKLNNLDENIKCGNSLIDDPEIAGDKAFDWNKWEYREAVMGFPLTFSKTFTKPKAAPFDIIIGNPPYGAKLSLSEQEYLLKKYNFGTTETVILFILKSLELLKDGGFMGFIIPKSFCFASNYAKIRNLVWENVAEIVDCGKVWNEVKLEQVIVIIQKGAKHNFYINKIRNNESFENETKVDKNIAKEFGFFLNGIDEIDIAKARQIKQNSVMLNDIANNIPGVPNQKYIGEGNSDYEMIGGAEFDRYEIKGIKGKIDKKWVENASGALVVENSLLVQNIIAHIENPEPHIKIIACIPTKNTIGKLSLANTINQIIIKPEFLEEYNNKYLWAVLNSNTCNWYMYNFVLGRGIRTLHFYSPVSSQLPIPKATTKQQTQIASLVDKIMEMKATKQKLVTGFVRLVQSKYKPVSVSKKLENWPKLEASELLDELKKQKAIISLKDQAKLLDYFATEKQKTIELQTKVEAMDEEIEQLVRGLYGLE